MNLSKENEQNKVSLSKPIETENVAEPVVEPVVEAVESAAESVVEPVVNLVKENKAAEPVVNLHKEENNTPNIMDENYNPLEGKIDMDKVHNMEDQANAAINEGIDQALGQAEVFLGKVSDKINNFVDSLDKPKTPNTNNTMGAGAAMNMGQNTNFNQYGQPNMNMGQPNLNPSAMANMVTPDKLKLEPTMAAIVSLLLCGLGQMINGQVGKGLTMLFGGMAAVFVITLVTCGIGAISAPIWLILVVLDAYNCAKILESGRPIGTWEFHFFK